ncbi:hypothetical protein HELRODRAFT_168918 [Helobdella robusta]|uniref:AGC-kinase C-terminal domain-containing protein n=1 Tax=Helobdella robusta TaxID=6412 RepID=T1F146_HELRO|nr:hypothetical protein HELRODRAFT_168918 [Helobdella robusta]ESO08988.1 hypothetical protein HELRODRAFT_168918 [Helobdella robusta]
MNKLIQFIRKTNGGNKQEGPSTDQMLTKIDTASFSTATSCNVRSSLSLIFSSRRKHDLTTPPVSDSVVLQPSSNFDVAAAGESPICEEVARNKGCGVSTVFKPIFKKRSKKQSEIDFETLVSKYVTIFITNYAKNCTNSICGTPDFIAPEMLKGGYYDCSVDWWSFGILLFEMRTGSVPFTVRSLLVKNPVNRIGCQSNSSDDIKNHPWFSKMDWFKLLKKKLPSSFIPSMKHSMDTSNFEACDETKVDEASKCLYFNEFENFYDSIIPQINCIGLMFFWITESPIVDISTKDWLKDIKKTFDEIGYDEDEVDGSDGPLGVKIPEKAYADFAKECLTRVKKNSSKNNPTVIYDNLSNSDQQVDNNTNNMQTSDLLEKLSNSIKNIEEKLGFPRNNNILLKLTDDSVYNHATLEYQQDRYNRYANVDLIMQQKWNKFFPGLPKPIPIGSPLSNPSRIIVRETDIGEKLRKFKSWLNDFTSNTNDEKVEKIFNDVMQ